MESDSLQTTENDREPDEFQTEIFGTVKENLQQGILCSWKKSQFHYNRIEEVEVPSRHTIPIKR